MVFNAITEEQRQRFFKQGCTAHLPGYTGHCPTLKFRVGKRFGACTEEIIKELIDKKVIKSSASNRLNIDKENAVPDNEERQIRRDWKTVNYMYKNAPYILGYTGYIPGFNTRYGLTFMKAVEEGGKEWREIQNKLRARRDSLRTHVEKSDPRTFITRLQKDTNQSDINQNLSIKKKPFFDNEISPEKPPIVGYTGHIPGAKGQVALSKRYTVAAKKGLELIHKEREHRINKLKNITSVERVLEAAQVNEMGYYKKKL